MKNYQLKNFLNILQGIKRDFIKVENGLNISDYIIDNNSILLGYTKDEPTKKSLPELIKSFENLIEQDKDYSVYEVSLFDIDSEENKEIEMIEASSDSIVLGIKNDYNDNPLPFNEWFFSDTDNTLSYTNDQLDITIDKEITIDQKTADRRTLGFSVFARTKGNGVKDNKLAYFNSCEAIINRFDFSKYNAEKPNLSLLKAVLQES
jgi:hypothetical protein